MKKIKTYYSFENLNNPLEPRQDKELAIKNNPDLLSKKFTIHNCC